MLPEARRCLLLASHTLLQLSIDGIVHTLGYTDSVEFDGGAAVEVLTVSGASRAVNLMTYGGVGGRLEIIRPGEISLSRRDALAVVVLDGQLRVSDAVLGRYDTLILGQESVRVRGEAATLVRVCLGEARDDLPLRTAAWAADGATDRTSDTRSPRTDHRGD
jgi:HutD